MPWPLPRDGVIFLLGCGGDVDGCRGVLGRPLRKSETAATQCDGVPEGGAGRLWRQSRVSSRSGFLFLSHFGRRLGAFLSSSEGLQIVKELRLQ